MMPIRSIYFNNIIYIYRICIIILHIFVVVCPIFKLYCRSVLRIGM